MNFTVKWPPDVFDAEPVYFEGEADLKHIQGNLYVGAHGMRTSRNALSWAAESFEMEIVPFRITNPYLYHLDCCLLRITEKAVLMCTSLADRICVRAIEQHCEIIDISLDQARAEYELPSATGRGFVDSNIMELDKENPKYAIEKSKIECLEKIGSRFGHALRVFCMSEFYKSGALLSCLIMHVRQLTDGAKQHCPKGRDPPSSRWGPAVWSERRSEIQD